MSARSTIGGARRKCRQRREECRVHSNCTDGRTQVSGHKLPVIDKVRSCDESNKRRAAVGVRWAAEDTADKIKRYYQQEWYRGSDICQRHSTTLVFIPSNWRPRAIDCWMPESRGPVKKYKELKESEWSHKARWWEKKAAILSSWSLQLLLDSRE